MQKKVFKLLSLMLLLPLTLMAQVTTAGMAGKVSDGQETIIGATITATHVPSGTVYRAVSNESGRYAINGMRAGGPYEVEVSYIGYKSKKFTQLTLALGQSTVLNVWLDESNTQLQEVQVFATGRSNMRTDRAGAVTTIGSNEIASLPTASRQLNDLMKLTPTAATTGSILAVGGGNYRQSYVTVDGAAYNNAFGIGSNLPGNGSPISIDALEQISVSTSPFDVRQNGFTGAAINAVTKAGTNELKGSAYLYTTNNHLRGNKVADLEEMPREQNHNTTYGFSLGGPIVKNKLFFFVNGEMEDNVKAGPTAYARPDGTEWDPTDNLYHRPTVSDMNAIQNYLATTYGYDPGSYQGYSDKAPAHKLLARLDWNIDENNTLNVRFSKSKSKEINPPSPSVSPLKAATIFPGNATLGIASGQGHTSNTALYFQSQRYSKDYNFTSVAAEWNTKWGEMSNTLRGTYSFQDEPRSYEGGDFPTTHILKDGAVYAAFGPDIFTDGNLVQVKNFVITDEMTVTKGIHKLFGGIQFESNKATNGFMQGGNGFFVYKSWNDFKTNATPSAYLVTMAARADGSQFLSEMNTRLFSLYLQDQINVSDQLRFTAGLRFEKPIYPALKDNYNHAFTKLQFDNNRYTTDQLPDGSVTLSPRFGFNWNIDGHQRYVLRGGTGYFVGRLPFVWLISAVGNSNCGQIQYSYMDPTKATAGTPTYAATVADQMATLDASKIGSTYPAAPSTPTIIDRNLNMNAVWKSALAFDARLPYGIDFTLEGLYSREYNSVVIRNANVYQKGTATTELAPGDSRILYSLYDKSVNPCIITNTRDDGAYYYSITASLAKKFDFGLNLSASYTYSYSRTYTDGAGDQVSSAYSNNRYSVNAVNEEEVGYGTFVSPNRLLISASYRKEYLKNFASTVSLLYDGMNKGIVGNLLQARYSYALSRNVVGDYGANNLMYIPASRQALDAWNFTDIPADPKKGIDAYSAKEQRDDFWAYIQQDSYLSKHTGEYAQRGGAVMPWHHQLDFKFLQDFYMNVGGKRNTLQLGVDIENVLNLVNKHWGLYKQVNSMQPLTINKDGSFNFARLGNKKMSETYSDYNNMSSTYQIMFSLRYIFN